MAASNVRQDANYTYLSSGSTAEILIAPQRCALIGIYPDGTTAGTVTIRDAATTGGSNVISLSAIGLTQQGKTFGNGMGLANGLTVQLSSASDKVLVVWDAFQ